MNWRYPRNFSVQTYEKYGSHCCIVQPTACILWFISIWRCIKRKGILVVYAHWTLKLACIYVYSFIKVFVIYVGDDCHIRSFSSKSTSLLRILIIVDVQADVNICRMNRLECSCSLFLYVGSCLELNIGYVDVYHQ